MALPAEFEGAASPNDSSRRFQNSGQPRGTFRVQDENADETISVDVPLLKNQ